MRNTVWGSSPSNVCLAILPRVLPKPPSAQKPGSSSQCGLRARTFRKHMANGTRGNKKQGVCHPSLLGKSKACAILVSWEKLLFLCLQSLPHPPSKPCDVLSLEAALCALSWEDTVSQAHCWAMLPQRCLGVSAPALASGSHCIAKGHLPTSDYLTHGLGEPGFASLSH